jgi:mono/diheme cytochrome c family protein
MVFAFHSKSTNAIQRGINAAFILAIIVCRSNLPAVNAAGGAGDEVKGKAVFTKNNCFLCHPGGENTMDPAHPIKGAAFSQKYKDDLLLESTIRKGFAREGMPSFSKSAIDEQDMKNLIAFVRSLSKPSKNTK